MDLLLLPQAEAQLRASIDGVLSEELRQRVEAHLRDKKRGLHVTLWHVQRDSMAALSQLRAAEGRRVGIELCAVAADEVCVAVSVRVLPAEDGQQVDSALWRRACVWSPALTEGLPRPGCMLQRASPHYCLVSARPRRPFK